ncbi:MAG: undecaprenyl-diphosphate phosphatase [Longimonas sp.]|uniref:undecaprenyl-diphosphate phosphatase n=1 Tax=Longimonas sp. TaxID=2039626 RepID=UPI00335B1CB3
MLTGEWLIALVAGVVQGLVEWLPVSSQGNVAIALQLVGGDPEQALQLALFVQIGTTAAAALYYRSTIREAVDALPAWRPANAFSQEQSVTSFIVLASAMTGVVGIPLYLFAVSIVSELGGGLFIALIGLLLIVTGIVQLKAEAVELGMRETPTFLDAVIVGFFQGFTILPGVSRSGTTVSVMLFRSFEGESALRLSFLLSIPASLAAGAMTVMSAGGLPGLSLSAALVAIGTAAVVGYVAIYGLMHLVQQIPFWVVCFGLGALAIVGGLTTAFVFP